MIVPITEAMTPELSLVPPGRLAALLSTARRRSELDVGAIAARSGGRYTVADLEAIERGQRQVDDVEVAKLTRLYSVHAAPIVPHRSELVVDLSAGMMSAGDEGISIGVGSGEVDVVLQRYLSLLYILRGLRPGSELTLRDQDLGVLSESLEQEMQLLERRLGELMLSGAVAQRTGLLSRRLSVPAAGLLVALTAVGALVFVGERGPNGADSSPVGATDAPPSEVVDTFTTPAQGGNTTAPPITVPNGLLPASFQSRSPTPEPPAPYASRLDRPPSLVATPSLDTGTISQIGRDAEAQISYDWRALLPGWTVEYLAATPGLRGLTHVPSQTIAIYVASDDTAAGVAGVLAHEIGHAIDVAHLSNADRKVWITQRGLPETWWPGNGAGDFHVGAGDFAEAVAAHLADSLSHSTHGPFSVEDLELLADILP